MCPIDLIKPPEKIFGRSVHVIAARIVGKVVAQGGSTQLLLEQIDFVEEKDDARPHEPSRVDHGIKEYQTLHHSILRKTGKYKLSQSREKEGGEGGGGWVGAKGWNMWNPT